LQKDQAGFKESKPAVTFLGVGLQILLLLLRLDYNNLVIPKQALQKMEDNTMKSRIKSLERYRSE